MPKSKVLTPAEASLQDSNAFKKAILESALDGILAIDEDDRIIEFNPAAEKIFGHRRSDALGQTLADLIVPARLREAHRRGMTHFRKTGRGPVLGRRVEMPALRADGTEIQVELAIVPIQVNGRTFFTAYVRDITQSRQVQQALEESEKKFRQLAENIGDVFWMSNPAQREMIYISPAYEKIWGRSCQSLYESPISFLEAVHPEDRQRVRQSMRRQMEGQATSEEYRIVRPDGSIRWIWDRGFPIKDAAGQVFRVTGLAEDITDRKQAEEAVKMSEDRYKSLFDQSPLAIQTWSLDGRVVQANRAWEQMYGVTVQDVRDYNLFEDPQLEKQGVTAYVKEALSGKAVIIPPVSFVPDRGLFQGRQIWVQTIVYPVRSAGGEMKELVAIQENVTDQKRAAEVLEKSEEQIRFIIDSAPVLMASLDERGRYKFVNKAYAERFNLSRAEIIGKTMAEVLGEEAYGRIRPYAEKALAGTAMDFEIEVPYREIGTHYMHCVYVPERPRAGGAAGFLAVITDITERKRAEVALSRLAAIIESSEDAIVSKDLHGVVKSWNQGAERLFGFSAEEMVGESILRIIPPELQHEESEILRRVNAGARIDHFETVRVRKDGTRLNISLSISPIRDSRGAIVGASKIARDMTERKRAEEALRSLNAELEQKVQERTRELEAFCYSVSHDLRAPLRSIAGFSEAILEDAHDRLDRTAQEHFNRIQVASMRMAQLIDNLLDLSRLTRKEMRRERVDLSAQARAIAEDLRRKDPDRHVDLAIQPGLAVPGDSELLRSVLQNLLGNAWKFTGKRPAARIEFGAVDKGNERIYFVRDNGAGFDMAYADKLFGAFQRLHGPEEFEGTGIGLATVQRIIQRHGGRVWAEGRVGQGAVFYFSFGSDRRPSEGEKPGPTGGPG
jgi:PAS domain S-box-containing protein